MRSLLDTGPPLEQKKSPSGSVKPERAKAAGRAADSSLPPSPHFCKPYRERLLLALAAELESWIASITTAEPPASQKVALAHVLGAMAIAKHRAVRRAARFSRATHPPNHHHSMIAINIQLDKINKARIFTSEKSGKRYLSFVLTDAPDDYGKAGQVVHSISREERLAGQKAEVVGSWKHLGGKKPEQTITAGREAP